MTARDDWERSMELTRLFIAAQLGPKPRRVAAQEAAIAHASDVLDSLTSDEVTRARRALAIEHAALTSRRRAVGWPRGRARGGRRHPAIVPVDVPLSVCLRAELLSDGRWGMTGGGSQ